MAGKLKYMSILTKAFAIASYVKKWHAESSSDYVVSKAEVMKLGAGLCALLGLKVSKTDQQSKP
jgi:hypothetical protein